MPAALSYPGVYIEEIPSGVRTITGVATSIAAFVGYTRQGPPDVPVPVFSFPDFERSHGGLDRDSPLSYAVRQFFDNGGTHALIVRVVAGATAARWNITDSHPTPDVAHVVLNAVATSPGTWANYLTLTIDAAETRNPNADFNLVITRRLPDRSPEVLETHRNLNMNPNSPYYAPVVVNAASQLVALPTPTPALTYSARALGYAISGAITLPVTATDWRIAGQVNGPDVDEPFQLTVPAPPPGESYTASELVTALSDAADAAVPDRLAVQLTDEAGVPNPAGTYVKISSLVTGARSRVAIDEGVRGGLASVIRMGLANGGREFTGDAEHRPAAAVLDVAGTAGVRGGPTQLVGGESGTTKTGMQALLDVDLFNILCIPETYGMTVAMAGEVVVAGITLCESRRAFYVVDPPSELPLIAPRVEDVDVTDWAESYPSRYAAAYVPAVQVADPLDGMRPRDLGPSGTVAGVFARTDSQRGVWKAPAGTDATLRGVSGLKLNMNDMQNGIINQQGVNALRVFQTYGTVVWGARTLRGADALADEYKYVPVRRLVLFLEESLYRGTKWVVFEPNDEPLWAQIRLNIGAFMHNLFRQGAFQGITPRHAYFVKCDRETTTQTDINLGIVNILVGFAPLKPAEFVVIKIQQMAGEIPT